MFDEFKDYEFGSRKYHDYDLNFDVPQAQLDETGFSQLSIKNQWNGTKFPLRIKTFVNVYESGGRPISRSVIQTIWPQEIAIGVRPSWLQNDADYAKDKVEMKKKAKMLQNLSFEDYKKMVFKDDPEAKNMSEKELKQGYQMMKMMAKKMGK